MVQCMILHFLKTMIPRDRWLIHWFGGLVWCLVLLVGRLLRDSLFGPPLYSPSPNISSRTISPKRDLEREKVARKKKKSSTTEKKYIPIKIRESVARTIRTCLGIVSNCVKLGFIGVCYSAARQIYYSWTLMNRARPHISKKRKERLKRENFFKQ